MGTYNRTWPRLSEPDIALLLDFQSDNVGKFTNWEYDLRVGPGRDPGPDYEDNIRRMAIMLSQRRIDAVAEAEDHHAIFEITQEAEHRPLSQLELYTKGFTDLRSPSKPVINYLICRAIRPDIHKELSDCGCRIYIYPPEQLADNDLGHPPTT